MSTYIQGLTDQVPQVPLYQMDTSFLQNTLDRRYARYQQGQSALGEAYASIQNAPLTGQRTKELRDKYLQESQAQLQKVAATDLSDPSNVSAGRKIFEPFWKDQSIIWDTGLTSAYQSEYQRGLQVRDSKDEKVRAQYSDISMRYLDGMREDIAEADGDVGRLQGVQQRRYVPMDNFNKRLNDVAKESGFEVVQTDAKGAYIRKVKNGPASLVSWETFALTNLGNEFSEEFRVMGVVDKEDRARGIRAVQPQLTKDQAIPLAVADAVGEIKEAKDANLKRYNDEIAKMQAMAQKVTGVSPADQAVKADYEFKVGQLTAMRDAQAREIREFDQAKYTGDALKNPDYFFASLAKDRVARSWAVGRASNISEEISANQAWNWERDEIHKDFQDQLAAAKNNREQDEWNMKKAGTLPGIGIGSTNAQGQRVDNDNKVVEQPVTYSGPDAVDPRQRQKIEAYQAWKDNLKGEMYKSAFDPNGILLLTDTMPGFESPSIRRNVASGLRKMLEGQGTTAEENAAVRAFQTELFKGKTPPEGKLYGPNGTMNALLKYAEDRINILQNNPQGTTITPEDAQALANLTNYKNAREQYNAALVEEKKIFKEKVLNNKDFKKIVVGEGENARFMTGNDIAKDFEALKLYPGTAGSFTSSETLLNGSKSYSKKELANLYSEGKLTFVPPSTGRPHGEVLIDGERYTVAQVGNITPGKDIWGTSQGNDRFTKLTIDLEKKYGTSTQLRKLREKASTDVIPNLSRYQSQTGTIGSVFDIHGDLQYNVAKEAALPGNEDGIYMNGELVADNAQRQSIQTVLSSDQLTKKYLTDIKYHVIGGESYVSFHVNPTTEKDPQAKNLEGLSEGEVRIKLAAGKGGQFINQLPNPSVNYMYNQLREGKPIVADPLFKASGYDYEVVPTLDNSAVDVYVTAKVFDNDPQSPTYGQKVAKKLPSQKFALSQHQPVDIMNYIYQGYSMFLNDNNNRYQQYQSAHKNQVK